MLKTSVTRRTIDSGAQVVIDEHPPSPPGSVSLTPSASYSIGMSREEARALRDQLEEFLRSA